MALIVQKYGGSSVGSVDKIKRIAEKVKRYRDNGDEVVVVVSAMGGETDRLQGLAEELDGRPVAREMDVLLSTGEQVTIALLAMALRHLGAEAQSFTGWQVPIVSDDAHAKARIQRIEPDNLRSALDAGNVAVVAGFQGITESGEISTLGRGGSDTTAVALAAALGADECQIYTDVDGVYTTDPRVVPNARRLEQITFEEMLEMASLGSKVLQIRAVEFAGKYGVPLRVLSTFDDGPGTLITLEDQVEEPIISGIAFTKDEAQLTVLGVPDRPGIAYSLLGPIGEHNIEVDMILQNVSGDSSSDYTLTDFTFTVHSRDFDAAKELLEKSAKELGAREVSGQSGITKVSLVGVGMRSHANVAARMFKALSDENINIRMISTTEIKISIVIETKYLELAVRALHDEFELDEEPQRVDSELTPTADQD
ncbi:aspartate kinase [Salinisphaera orenii]|uniref:Aspartokinase n=1 Tax=Salinisphaera orenii YIM 95161 TaxID=1051139 RepID=A0A423Q9E2_9GAMM|nr:aspartate kinase [Salinisphaera halophila]ROO36721.1 aspartokinase [Salinisphaera halophila YIM 95161]